MTILTACMRIFILSHILESEVIEVLRRREIIPKYITLINSFYSYEFVMTLVPVNPIGLLEIMAALLLTNALTDQAHMVLPLNSSLQLEDAIRSM